MSGRKIKLAFLVTPQEKTAMVTAGERRGLDLSNHLRNLALEDAEKRGVKVEESE